VLSDSITKRVGFEGALPSFNLEIRRLLRYCKEIPFLHIRQSLYEKASTNTIRSYSAADAAVAHASLLDWCKSDGEFESATMAVSKICLLGLCFCHGQMSNPWVGIML